MRGKLEGLDAIWDANERRHKVYNAYPQLERLERNVAAGLVQFVQGKVSMEHVAELRAERDSFLSKHNIPVDYAEPRWRCTICQDEGFVEGKICACRKQDELNRLFAGSGLPPRLKAETFDRFDLKWYSPIRKTPAGVSEREIADEARKACMRFVATCVEGRTARGLYVYGAVGLGKTLLLSAVCNALVQHRVPTLYMVFSDLIADIKKSFEQDSAWTESALMAAAKKTNVLILDDLGAEHITDFVINRLFDIVNYRRNHDLPLVASSNLSIPEVGAWYGDRVASRLWEICSPIPLYGQDIRVQKTRQS